MIDLVKEMQQLKEIVDSEYNEIKAVCAGLSENYSSVIEFLDDVPDIEYTCTSTFDYLGADVYLVIDKALVWIETRHHVLRGRLGSQSWTRELPEWAVESLDFNLNVLFDYHKEG